MKHGREKSPERKDSHIQVAMDQRVLTFITDELGKHPQVEEGGKYLGYLLQASDSRLSGLGFDQNAPLIVITDFLPSGPNAVRTAVELQPDGEYQEKLFRQAEQTDGEIEHVGTWHSHHCNGLQTLSSGDVAGYLRTINRTEYRLDFFLASLVTRLPRGANDQTWIDHYLFVRGDEDFYRINQLIKVIDWPTRFARITGHSIESNVRKDHQHAKTDSTPRASAWYETTQGKMMLAEDKRFFTERFKQDVKATRRGRSITLTGRIGRVTVSMTYPGDADASQIAILVVEHDKTIMEINTHLEWRRLAITAAVGAATELI